MSKFRCVNLWAEFSPYCVSHWNRELFLNTIYFMLHFSVKGDWITVANVSCAARNIFSVVLLEVFLLLVTMTKNIYTCSSSRTSVICSVSERASLSQVRKSAWTALIANRNRVRSWMPHLHSITTTYFPYMVCKTLSNFASERDVEDSFSPEMCR